MRALSENNTKRFRFLKKLLVFPGVFFLLLSCENDIEKIKSLTDPGDLPDVRADTIEIIYTDSSRLQMIVKAPGVLRFSNLKRPYLEFPEGIHVWMYNDSSQVESEIISNYALYYNEERFWEARGDVMVHNLVKDEKLNTEELFWDENKEIIYSNSFSRIESADGTFYGQEGFESNQEFSKWKLKGSKGTVKFKETENPKGGETTEPNVE